MDACKHELSNIHLQRPVPQHKGSRDRLDLLQDVCEHGRKWKVEGSVPSPTGSCVAKTCQDLLCMPRLMVHALICLLESIPCKGPSFTQSCHASKMVLLHLTTMCSTCSPPHTPVYLPERQGPRQTSKGAGTQRRIAVIIHEDHGHVHKPTRD